VDSLRGLLSSGVWSDATFCNCGPEQMMVAAAELERRYADPSRIYLGIERHASCGIGLCGKCALDGYRTCIDGPVMTLDQLSGDGDFGHYHREACGRRLRF
jgi:dihydroorotate dehydrogenase electron transfer subunit